jgi:hypothetical protein
MHARDESPKYLGKDIVRSLSPWEALPDGKAKHDGGVEVSTRCWAAGNDSKGNTNGITPSNLDMEPKAGSVPLMKEAWEAMPR